MSRIYQAFGNQGQQLVYKLLTRLEPELNSDMKKSKQGATTDPEIVAGIIEYLHSQINFWRLK